MNTINTNLVQDVARQLIFGASVGDIAAVYRHHEPVLSTRAAQARAKATLADYEALQAEARAAGLC